MESKSPIVPIGGVLPAFVIDYFRRKQEQERWEPIPLQLPVPRHVSEDKKN